MEKSENSCKELERQKQDGVRQEEALRRAYYNKQVMIAKEIIDEIISKLKDGHMPQNGFLCEIEGVEYVTMKIFDDSCHWERGDRAFLLSNGNTYFVHRYDYNVKPVAIVPEDLCRLAGAVQVKTGLIDLAKEYFGIVIKSHWTNVPSDNKNSIHIY